MDNCFLLQKQVRENSEELRSYLTDLQSWEKDMKRKDQELLEKSPDVETYPAIRSKAKRSKSAPETNLKASESKRIPAYDYAAWDKFDVEKACAEVDTEEEETVDVECGEGIEKGVESRDQALYEKELGNEHVKNQRWKEAIECYSRAIQCYPYDAVFYANRALCYLKTNKAKAAEADCTTALQLDETYVKALQRRGLARTQLGFVDDARDDFQRVLQLEPSNSAAKTELAKLERKSTAKKASAKSTVKIPQTSQSTQQEKGSKGRIASEQLRPSPALCLSEQKAWVPPWALPCDVPIEPLWKPAHLRSKKPLVAVAVKDVQEAQEQQVQAQHRPQAKPEAKVEAKPEAKVEAKPEAKVEAKPEAKVEAKPEAKVEAKPEAKVEAKPEAKVEAKPEAKVEAKPEAKVEAKPEAKVEAKPEAKVEAKPAVKVEAKLESEPEMKSEGGPRPDLQPKLKSSSEDSLEEVPPPPKSSVQFLLAWKRIKHNAVLRHRFLKQVCGEALPLIFQDTLESREFSEVLQTLKDQFVPNKDRIYPYLLGFTKVKRFSALVMFMGAAEKTVVRMLIGHCEGTGECSSEEAAALCDKFEIKR